MNKYIDASLYHGKEKICSGCGMDKSKANGCCSDRHDFVKVKTGPQQAGVSYDFSFLQYTPVIESFFIQHQVPVSSIIEPSPSGNAPPNIHGRGLYILHCVFLI